MKLIILALFSLILSGRSEDKTRNKAEDKKNEDSASYDRYVDGEEYSQNDDRIRYDDGYYYSSGNEKANHEEYDGRSRSHGEQPYHSDENEEEYSKHDGKSKAVGGQSYAYDRADEKEYPRHDEKSKTESGQLYHYDGGDEKEHFKNDGRPNNYGEDYKNYVILEPEYIGYVGHKKAYGNKEVYKYRLIGRIGLGFDKRTATAYGLRAPITPPLLQVVGKFYPKAYYNHY